LTVLGVDGLLETLRDRLARLRVEVVLEIPFTHGELVARVHAEGEVLDESYSERGTHLVARLNRDALDELAPYLAPVEGMGSEADAAR
jgi:GTPase